MPKNTGFEYLEPSHFEWLDYAEEFFKQNGNLDYGHERNNNVQRNGTRYPEISGEYHQQERLHNIDPEHFAKPLMTLENNEEIVGFYIERVEGVDLQDYLRESQDIDGNREIMREIKEVVEELERYGVVHGDLANNGIYNPENGDLKFIDPVGVPKSRDDWEKMRELDLSDFERLENTAYSPFGKFVEPV